MTEEELKAAQAELEKEKEALEAAKKELEAKDDTELQAKLKANETTIAALQDKIKELDKKPDPNKKAKPTAFDAEQFKADLVESMSTTVADLVKSGLEAATTQKTEQDLIAKIKEVEKDFDSEGFNLATLKKYHSAITKQAKINPDTPAATTGGIFQIGSKEAEDPAMKALMELRKKAAKGDK